MSVIRVARAGAAAAVVALLAVAGCGTKADTEDPSEATPRQSPSQASASQKPAPTAVRLPPPHAGFDYQIGGAYPPPRGVRVISRDRTASPAPGLYNICYVNAFQAQPGDEKTWPADLLLRDDSGEVVIDQDWNEALLDIGTAAKRARVATRIDQWIDGCAAKGFDAVEPDNYDSYTRSDDLLSAQDATAFIALLSAHAHARHLAIGQKNTLDLAGQRKRTGLDFAVTEECGQYDECDAYAKAFDDHVVDVEYTDSGLRKALAGYGDRLSIVRRDRNVSTPDNPGYVRRTN